MNNLEFGEIVESKGPQSQEFGEIVDVEKPVPGYRSVIKGLSKAASSLPTNIGPISPSGAERLLEKQLPTPKTGAYPYVESISEGAGEGLKFGPVGAAAGAVGGALKELAKQKNAPQWVQTAAEIAPWLFTERGLIPKKGQKEIVDFLRKQKFTDKEITPLLQGKSKLNFFGKIGKRGAKVEERLSDIGKRFKESYGIFRNEGKKLPLPKNKIIDFENKFEDVWDDIPVDQRKLLQELKEDLFNKPITRASLQDFFHGINRNVYGKGAVGNKEILNKLKEPIYEGIGMIDPSMSKDFRMLNSLNEKKYEVLKKLSPDKIDRFFSIAEYLGLAGALASGNLKYIAGAIGENAARHLMTEMVINPQLQNITKKMVSALAKNKVPVFEKLYKTFTNVLSKNDKELADKLQES